MQTKERDRGGGCVCVYVSLSLSSRNNKSKSTHQVVSSITLNFISGNTSCFLKKVEERQQHDDMKPVKQAQVKIRFCFSNGLEYLIDDE